MIAIPGGICYNTPAFEEAGKEEERGMTPKDLSELKRRLDPDKRYPSAIWGCYVNDEGEVLLSFCKPVATLSQDEVERYMAIFRKVLSGTQGQNLLPVDFPGTVTPEDEAFGMLNRLRTSRLQDEEARNQLFGHIMAWLNRERAARPQSMDVNKHAVSNLVLLLEDTFDVYYRRKDGEEDRERSDSSFGYFLCCVCPVKPRKQDLAYLPQDGDFRMTADSMAVGMPELGFLYPAMEQGAADIYRAMLYTRDIGDAREPFVEEVFQTRMQMPAAEQRDTVSTLLAESLQEECSMDTLQAVHERITGMIQAQKEDKRADPLSMGGREVGRVLKDCGVSEEKAAAFEQEFEETFGDHAEIPAVNLVSPREFRVKTPSVSIRVDPSRSELVSTRVIDGQRYIMILADGAVEVNGVNIAIE